MFEPGRKQIVAMSARRWGGGSWANQQLWWNVLEGQGRLAWSGGAVTGVCSSCDCTPKLCLL